MYTWKNSVITGKKSRRLKRMLRRMKVDGLLQQIQGNLVEATWMLNVHDIEGIEVGAHINGKEIRTKITGTQGEERRGMRKDIIVIKEESRKSERKEVFMHL